jgi:uncharacterized protein
VTDKSSPRSERWHCQTISMVQKQWGDPIPGFSLHNRSLAHPNETPLLTHGLPTPSRCATHCTRSRDAEQVLVTCTTDTLGPYSLSHVRRRVIAMTGEPTHIELGAPDAKKAKEFFGSLFDWTFEQYGEGDQAAIQTPTIRGGLHDGVPTGTLVTYFRVDDINDAVAKVRQLGGQADGPSPDEPGFGRFSTCTDNQGIPFGLCQVPEIAP